MKKYLCMIGVFYIYFSLNIIKTLQTFNNFEM